MGLFDRNKKKNQEKQNSAETLETVEPKEDAVKEETVEETEGLDSVYLFIPLFENPVQMPTEEVLQKTLADRMGHVAPSTRPVPPSVEKQGVTVFEMWDLMAYNRKDQRKYPPQLVIASPGSFNRGMWQDRMVRQFRSCGTDREQFMSRCRYSFVCSVMLTGQLQRRLHGKLISDFADVMLELFPDCIGIYWPYSENLVSREYYQGKHWNDTQFHIFDGGLNVRVFRVGDGQELLVDTLGLTMLGLPDLQMYCKELEPEAVVLFLKNFASMLYANGDTLKDGDFVEGKDREKWECRHADALVSPGRRVLDITPGKYAGERRQ